jgi:hypothetical protein
MKAKYFKNQKNSFNNFNPFICSEKIITQIINGNSSNYKCEFQNSNKRFKKKTTKKQAINFNSNQIKKSKKNVKNIDINRDIYNTINVKDYNTNKKNKIKKCIKLPQSEINQSRNFNKLNGNYLNNKMMGSYSLTNDIKSYIKQNTKKEYDLDKLRESGIKYCFDEDGNPMDIIDIKNKNKNPIAFIIQTTNKNILMDTNNKIISPNNNGDYTLPHLPYIIIHKYDVLNPELRVIKSNNKEKNEKIIGYNSLGKRIANNSSNPYNIDSKDINGLKKMDENVEDKKDNFQFFSPIAKSKIECFTNLNNNIKRQKRKYILVNRLYDFNKSVQLKLDNNEENNKSLSKKNIQTNENTFNDNYFKQNDHYYTINNDENKNTSQFMNNNYSNNILLKSNNKISVLSKMIKQNKINKDLEFNFERKYSSIKNIINPEQKANITENQEVPNKKNEMNFFDNFISIHKNSNAKRTRKILLFKQNQRAKFELNKPKRQKYSYSLNEYMLNPLINSKQAPNIINNDYSNWNTLTTFNQSIVSPTPEKTIYSTNQQTNNESGSNKCYKKSIIKNNSNNKYYLKPKIKSAKFFHKRIKTENMSNGQNIKFLQTIENMSNKINDNKYITPFSLTEVDFNLNKKNHDSRCNNSVCKCPYCHNLFYN